MIVATTHRVSAGECILTLSEAYGVPVDKIWNHPQNSDLKRRRGNPNVLKEGDQVFVPDVTKFALTRSTGGVHEIVIKRPTAKLKLRVVVDPGQSGAEPEAAPAPANRKVSVGEDPEPSREARHDEPRANVKYVVELDEVRISGVTDGDGVLECDIPTKARSGRLILAPGTPDETVLPLNLGHLDPIDTVSGVKQRLANLCFDCGDRSDEETPGFASALRAFQTKQGLAPTGQLTSETRHALQTAHGS
ncbi:MAG TPA: peptidoglycan-binding domain-containing protein [Polyangiaceae bacterium]|nr:peptidoglycan-binding domain-containing protein [Polyangiaceae bacterium]